MKGRGWKLLCFVPLALLCVLIGLAVLLLFSCGYVDFLLHGPNTVLSVRSPDGNYEAYVEDWPSIDGPNQSAFVERKDKLHFLRIAKLPEDIDYIKEILWSPDSRIVIFHSCDHLTATRVSDWRTLRIYLGEEWRRALPQRHRTVFTSGGGERRVETIQFPEPGVFTYRIEGDEQTHTVRMASLVEDGA